MVEVALDTLSLRFRLLREGVGQMLGDELTAILDKVEDNQEEEV